MVFRYRAPLAAKGSVAEQGVARQGGLEPVGIQSSGRDEGMNSAPGREGVDPAGPAQRPLRIHASAPGSC